MVNKFFNMYVSLFTAVVSLCGCVDDPSTTGDGYVENSNTFAPAVMRNIMDEHEQKVVNFFVNGANTQTGMAYNSSTDKQTLTTGASGFGVMNLVVGAERGWVTREQAIEQVLKITRFLKKADRFAGAWAHWYKPNGEIIAFGDQKQAGEIVETAFMMGGLLTACEYFDGNSEAEREIRANVEGFWHSIEWNRFIKDGKLYWIWHQDENRYELPLVGWNETLLVYILGMAAPDNHKIPVDVYRGCWQGYNFSNQANKPYGYKLPLGGEKGGPLFLAHYSFLGLDPRLMQDTHCFYWQQNQSHTMVNRHYCVYEAPAEHKYSVNDWGLTACGGCGSHPEYMSRDNNYDDGIIAPTAAISSFPYTPFYSAQVLLNLERNYSKLNGKYGFGISYSPSENAVGTEYLAMEHAPMAIMMENYRSGLIWKLLMKNEYIKKGLQLAEISVPKDLNGFYMAVINSVTNVYDMMRHPDHECYEIDYYTQNAGSATLTLATVSGEEVYRNEVPLSSGANVISFFSSDIFRGKKYTLTVTEAQGSSHTINVSLH